MEVIRIKKNRFKGRFYKRLLLKIQLLEEDSHLLIKVLNLIFLFHNKCTNKWSSFRCFYTYVAVNI